MTGFRAYLAAYHLLAYLRLPHRTCQNLSFRQMTRSACSVYRVTPPSGVFAFSRFGDGVDDLRFSQVRFHTKQTTNLILPTIVLAGPAIRYRFRRGDQGLTSAVGIARTVRKPIFSGTFRPSALALKTRISVDTSLDTNASGYLAQTKPSR